MCCEVYCLIIGLRFSQFGFSPFQEFSWVSGILQQEPIIWVADLRIKCNYFEVIEFSFVESIQFEEIGSFITKPMTPHVSKLLSEIILPLGHVIEFINWIGFMIANLWNECNIQSCTSEHISQSTGVLNIVFLPLLPNIVGYTIPSPEQVGLPSWIYDITFQELNQLFNSSFREITSCWCSPESCSFLITNWPSEFLPAAEWLWTSC